MGGRVGTEVGGVDLRAVRPDERAQVGVLLPGDGDRVEDDRDHVERGDVVAQVVELASPVSKMAAKLASNWPMTGANDGPDSFFLVPQQVPAPIAGAGIPGLIAACGAMIALARNRKRKQELGAA